MSYSQWATYRQCPLKLRLSLEHRDEIDVSRFLVGRAVHEAAKDWDRERGTLVKLAVEKLYEAASEVSWKLCTLRKESQRAAMLAEKLEPLILPILSQPSVEQEVWFDRDVDGVNVRGVVDILHKDAHVLYDIKTGKGIRWLDPQQLYFYAWLVGSVQRAAFITPAADRPMYYYPVRVQHVVSVASSVSDTIRRINDGEFPARPGPKCRWCDYRRWCEGERDGSF